MKVLYLPMVIFLSGMCIALLWGLMEFTFVKLSTFNWQGLKNQILALKWRNVRKIIKKHKKAFSRT